MRTHLLLHRSRSLRALQRVPIQPEQCLVKHFHKLFGITTPCHLDVLTLCDFGRRLVESSWASVDDAHTLGELSAGFHFEVKGFKFEKAVVHHACNL